MCVLIWMEMDHTIRHAGQTRLSDRSKGEEMFTFRTMRRSFLIAVMALFATSQAYSQHSSWQKPVERDPAEVARIMGPIGELEPSRDLNIVWVWGIDKLHEKETHEYGWVMDRYVFELLPKVPRVTVTPAYNYPTKDQWEKADLVVFYLWPHQRDSQDYWDYDIMDRFQQRGGGLIFLHFAVAEYKGGGQELAKRIGYSYGGTWGVLPSPVSLTAAASDHPIFRGFPAKIDFMEEFYWNLVGDPSTTTPLVTSPAGPKIANKPSYEAPVIGELDGKEWPVMWTKEVGKSKTFTTVLGHNFWTFNDPYFRIILLRAMAWSMNESFDPFKPLVNLHNQR